MKKLLLSSAAVIAVAAGAPAFAADLPAYEAPMPVETVATVAPLWTGMYVGGQLGYAFENDDDDSCFSGTVETAGFPVGFLAGDTYDCDDYNDPLATDDTFGGSDGDDGSLFAGAHIGYDQQFGSFVVGAVLEANWLFGHDDDDDDDGEDTFDLDAFGPFATGPEGVAAGAGSLYPTVSVDGDNGNDWYGTARLRAGYAMGRALLYATGGLAFGGNGGSGGGTAFFAEDTEAGYAGFANLAALEAEDDCEADTVGGDLGVSCDFGDDDDVNIGWALGAGVEFLATNNFSVGIEYLYVNLGHDDDGEEFVFLDDATLELDEGGDDGFHTISVRGSYRFNFGG